MNKLLFIFFAGLLAFSCNVSDKFSVIEAPDPVFSGLTSVHGSAWVASSSRHVLVIENAELRFRYKKRELASARLMLPVTVPADAVSVIRYDLKLESESLSNLQLLQNRMETNPSQVFADITAYIRYGNIRRKVKLEDVPYIGIIATFGGPENE